MQFCQSHIEQAEGDQAGCEDCKAGWRTVFSLNVSMLLRMQHLVRTPALSLQSLSTRAFLGKTCCSQHQLATNSSLQTRYGQIYAALLTLLYNNQASRYASQSI